MSVKRVTPDEAAALLEAGWKYVDVRSVPEFDQGHPEGAYNVPFMTAQPGGEMTSNPDFVEVMQRRFAPEDAIVLGCRSGNRSLRAATALVERGFSNVVDMRGGFDGETDGDTGKVVCGGWQSRGLPVASEAAPGRSYRELAGEG